jgi:hypothetical protein
MSDTIYTAPGATFHSSLDNAPTGLVGTVGVQIIRKSDEAVVTARTTAGIVESPAGSGRYVATLVAPAVKADYTVFWDTGSVTPTTTASDELVVTATGFPEPEGESPEAGMPMVTLADFRPSPRFDGTPWTEARVEKSDGPPETAPFSTLETIVLDPVDEDPTKPALRSFTVATKKPWLRITFLDAGGAEDGRSALIATSGPQFRPTLTQVSAVLRARTYTDESEEAGEFGANTRPTATEVEGDVIPQACRDVALAAGTVPGEMLDQARRVAALKTAAEIERSYLPEQSAESLGAAIYTTLRITADEGLEQLVRDLQWWHLNEKV